MNSFNKASLKSIRIDNDLHTPLCSPSTTACSGSSLCMASSTVLATMCNFYANPAQNSDDDRRASSHVTPARARRSFAHRAFFGSKQKTSPDSCDARLNPP
ncbi:hypothetical protein C8R46DRAFT_1233781 [Mycena filopes]|nr:hypothetical protein C8R46DRAFT_1233781 [Mycena filopes]